MHIGTLAERTDTPVETVRYYEKAGLLRKPARTSANYRRYDESHVEELHFIRQCRSLDMSLAEIHKLLAFQRKPPTNCSAIDALLEEHMEHVAARLKALKALSAQLKTLRAMCHERMDGLACGVLKGLGGRGTRESKTVGKVSTKTTQRATPSSMAKTKPSLHVAGVHRLR